MPSTHLVSIQAVAQKFASNPPASPKTDAAAFASLSERSASTLPAAIAALAAEFVQSLDIGPPVADCCAEDLHQALSGMGKKQSTALTGFFSAPEEFGGTLMHRLARKPDSRAQSALDCFEQFVAPHLTRSDLASLAHSVDRDGLRPAQIAAQRGDSVLAARFSGIEGLGAKKLSPWPWAHAGVAESHSSGTSAGTGGAQKKTQAHRRRLAF